MKLGDVLKKERDRRKLSAEEVARRIGVVVEQYQEMESGESAAEEWGPKLALIAIQLKTPTSRLIAETGRSAQARQIEGQCGKLISSNREKRGFSTRDLAEKLAIPTAEMEAIESGKTALET